MSKGMSKSVLLPTVQTDTMEVTLLSRLLACVAYGAVSVSITLFNKAVFSYYKFNFPNLFTTLQILVSLLYMIILRSLKVMDFGAVTWKTSKQVLPLAFFWWLYVVSGVTALRYLNVPMYSVLRRSTTLLVVVGEFLAFSKVPSPLSMAAMLLMIAGAIMAGATDLTFNLPGYIFVSICAVSTAIYLLLIRMLKDKTGLSQSGLLYYNNVLALPMMAAYMLLGTNEVNEVAMYPLTHDLKFQVFLLVSASQAFLLNLCIFRCTTMNSPLATTVTGQMKDILTTGLGMFLFGDVRFEAKNVAGVCVGLLGGIAYSLISYRDSRLQKRSATRK